MEFLPYLLIALLLLIVLLQFLFRNKNRQENEVMNRLLQYSEALRRMEEGLKSDFRANREESARLAKEQRMELSQSLSKLGSELKQSQAESFRVFQESFSKSVESFNEMQKIRFKGLEDKQSELVRGTETRLENIRATVEEKLSKTLSERLGQSFDTVGKQLLEVQKGLGEMQSLAQDVGGLKKVLGNVKMRGGIGEVQLSMLLEQILAPEQYEANVKTRAGSAELVEFAVKLPGRDDAHRQVWLPIDAKFPKEVFEHLQTAYDQGDAGPVEIAQKNLEAAIRKMARDISDKYLDPPNTTDFAIMFLPFEGIYAEVVRKASLLEDLQRNYKVVVTGPSTLAAILNSLHMGFRTLAIQKRSSEVWQVLGAVKKEFELFGALLDKSRKNLQTGIDQLDDVMGKRSRAIERKLRSVESLGEADAGRLPPPVYGPEDGQ